MPVGLTECEFDPIHECECQDRPTDRPLAGLSVSLSVDRADRPTRQRSLLACPIDRQPRAVGRGGGRHSNNMHARTTTMRSTITSFFSESAWGCATRSAPGRSANPPAGQPAPARGQPVWLGDRRFRFGRAGGRQPNNRPTTIGWLVWLVARYAAGGGARVGRCTPRLRLPIIPWLGGGQDRCSSVSAHSPAPRPRVPRAGTPQTRPRADRCTDRRRTGTRDTQARGGRDREGAHARACVCGGGGV